MRSVSTEMYTSLGQELVISLAPSMVGDALNPAISAVVVTHNSAVTILPALRSLREAAGNFSLEGIVVDASSADGTAEIVSFSGLADRLLEVENRGFAAAANAGAARARGSLLLFLNPDTALPPHCLTTLAAHLAHPRVVAASGLLLDRRGRAEPWGEPFPSLSWYLRRRIRVHRPSQSPGIARSVPWLCGAVLLVRASSFWAIGGFREDFFLYYEDVDLARRLRARGGILVFDPAVRIRHLGGQSAKTGARLQHSDAAEDHYFSVHRPRWERDVLRVLRRLLRVPWLALFVGAGALAGWTFAGGVPWVGLGVLASAGLLFSAVARVPDIGALVLFGSLVPGQLLRIPVFAASALTVTDALLPLVLFGWLWSLRTARACAASFPAARKARSGERPARRRRALFGAVVLLPLFALFPGLLLAGERLPLSEWGIAAGYAGRLVLILAIVPLAARSLRRLWLVPAGLVSVAVLLLGLGVLQLWALPSLQPSPYTGALCEALPRPCPLDGWDAHPGRLFSTWLDPNLLGALFVLAASVLLVLPAPRRRPLRFLLASAGLLLLVALLLTKSRTALGALAVVSVASGLLYRTWRRLVPLVTAGALGLLLVPELSRRLGSLWQSDPTVSLRLHSWSQAIEHLLRFPWFGSGYNSYGFEQIALGNIQNLQIHSRAGADSSLLTFLATTGVWGLGLLAVFVGVLLWVLYTRSFPRVGRPSGSRERIRKAKASPPPWIARAAFLALLGLLAHAQFTHSLVYVHLAVPLALLLGAAFGEERFLLAHARS